MLEVLMIVDQGALALEANLMKIHRLVEMLLR
jgi:hypothetical protein